MLCIIIGHLANSSINRVVFTFHVMIFYLISGYFISEKKTLGAFIKTRFRKLIIPYWLSCAVIIAISTIYGILRKGMPGAFAAMKEWILASLYGSGTNTPFDITPIGAIWFLLASFLWYSTRYVFCFIYVFGLFSQEDEERMGQNRC